MMLTESRFLLPEKDFEPAYLGLYRSGELEERVQEGLTALENCTLCPRLCKVNRVEGFVGVCKTSRQAVVSSAFPHMGEENPLRGHRGSGTIFFSQCNLRCVFCQNFDISHETSGKEVTAEELAGMMLALQGAGCHNINLVTPDHVVVQILEALLIAIEGGLRLPIVYNTSGYTSLKLLNWLNGVVDIYMPDFKFANARNARRYTKAMDYPATAKVALMEMHKQVGVLKMDEHGIARRGVLVRHLVMPDDVAETGTVMRFLAERISKDTYVNIMGQYRPAGKVSSERVAEINRPVTGEEMKFAYQVANEAGLWRFDKRYI
jgi:putative pyruvate formate lyase activating enzyme